MSETLFTAPMQKVWHAPKKRGCYQLWARAQAAAGNVPDGPGRAKKPEGGDNG